MPVFIPRKFREHRPNLTSYCQLCAARGLRKKMYKLRDGPTDRYFCNGECAGEYVDKRHSCVKVNAFLKLLPYERKCGPSS